MGVGILQPLETRGRRPGKNEFVAVAHTRAELLRHLRAIVRDLAPAWEEWDRATIEIADRRLTRRDVQSAFDQIEEKYHVDRLTLRFDKRAGEPLHAILEQTVAWEATPTDPRGC